MMLLLRLIVCVFVTFLLAGRYILLGDASILLLGVAIAFLWEIAARLVELNKTLSAKTNTNTTIRK